MRCIGALVTSVCCTDINSNQYIIISLNYLLCSTQSVTFITVIFVLIVKCFNRQKVRQHCSKIINFSCFWRKGKSEVYEWFLSFRVTQSINSHNYSLTSRLDSAPQAQQTILLRKVPPKFSWITDCVSPRFKSASKVSNKYLHSQSIQHIIHSLMWCLPSKFTRVLLQSRSVPWGQYF